ncbi:MAG: SDR family NAD(P)-dependent oxidoreductase [Coprococcus phoceensis]
MNKLKIAIVTGASSGLGKEFVKQIEHLYKELDEIWVIARRRERLEELKSCMFTNVRILEGNLCEQNIYQELKVLLKEKEPDIRMLVNAAGFGKIGEVKKLSAEDQLDMIELNCKALTHMTKICIPYMTRGSRIVNVASAAAFCPQPSFSVYAATKSYVLSFSRSLRTELCDEEIFVTAVCPGLG